MMPHQNECFLVYGAGGHAKVIIDILELSFNNPVISVFDDNACVSRSLFGYKIISSYADLLETPCQTIVAIGDNKVRRRVVETVLDSIVGFTCPLLHPTVIIGKESILGKGTVAMAGAVINPLTRIGTHCIINTGCRIDHDCILGDFVHIAPGTVLCGNVTIGEGSFIGAGSTILPGIVIGKNVVVGAGTTVFRNIKDNLIVSPKFTMRIIDGQG